MMNRLIFTNDFRRKHTPDQRRATKKQLFSKKARTPMRSNKFSDYLKNTKKKIL